MYSGEGDDEFRASGEMGVVVVEGEMKRGCEKERGRRRGRVKSSRKRLKVTVYVSTKSNSKARCSGRAACDSRTRAIERRDGFCCLGGLHRAEPRARELPMKGIAMALRYP